MSTGKSPRFNFAASDKRDPDTLIARMGFRDPELPKPAHDDLVLWLDERVRDPDWFAPLIPVTPAWEDIEREMTQYVRRGLEAFERAAPEVRENGGRHWCWKGQEEGRISESAFDAAWQTFRDWTVPPRPPPQRARLAEAIWEHPVGDRRWVAGFVDIYATVDVPYPMSSTRIGGANSSVDYATDQQPPIPPTWAWGWVKARHPGIAFEAKLEIPSVGELIRQVRFYERKWSGDAPLFMVVSPDTRHTGTLLRQGIGLVSYPDGKARLP